jgi:hypothetical protein
MEEIYNIIIISMSLKDFALICKLGTDRNDMIR